MPAPELLDVEPLEEKRPSYSKSNNAREGGRRMKVSIADDATAEKGRRAYSDDDDEDTRRPGKAYDERAYDVDEDDGDDTLFDAPDRHQDQDVKRRAGSDQDRAAPEKGWRKGRQFIVEDEDDDDAERRQFFMRNRKEEKKQNRESLRFADEADARGHKAARQVDDDRDEANSVVDADWEAVGEGDGPRERGFGRKVRADRRRATALARMEDVRPLDPDAFDDEFFASLRVTPRELERALRKARRRAEAREKNRLTPWRAFGWTAWLAMMAGVIYALFVYRDEIVKAAPKAADAYAVIGIEANPYGLSIQEVNHRLAMSTGGPVIEITGSLRNETATSVTAPLMQAEALGAGGELLARWTFSASDIDIAEGESVSFMTRAAAPDGVTEVALSFAPSGSVINKIVPEQGKAED